MSFSGRRSNELQAFRGRTRGRFRGAVSSATTLTPSFVEQAWGRRAALLPGAVELFPTKRSRTDLLDRLRRGEELGLPQPLTSICEDRRDYIRGELRPLPWSVVVDCVRRPHLSLLIQVDRYHLLDEEVASACRQISEELPVLGDFTASLLAGGPGRGLALHADPVSVFHGLLWGQKRWLVTRDPLAPWMKTAADGIHVDLDGRTVRFGNGPSASIVRFEQLEWAELIQRPGDVVYLPPGCLHQTDYEQECFGVTLGFRHVTRFELLHQLMVRAFGASAEWEAPVPPTGAPIPSERLAELRRFIDSIDWSSRLEETRAALDQAFSS